MALMATCPDLTWDSWLAQSQLHHHAVPDDIWSKFGLGQEKAVALPNPTVDTHLSPFDMGTYVGGVGSDGEGMHPMGALPTPPHSPPTEHDLDDLVASIPEILESPSASPPSDISIILSDLEGMDTTPLGESASPASRLEGSWGTDWWGGVVAAPAMEASLKRDIMWGAGVCNNNGSNVANSTSAASPTTPTTTTTSCAALAVKKERQVSECSTDAVLRDVIRADDLSEDSDDSDDNMPDTPSGTDSDCDADDQLSETWSSASPRSTSSPAARHATHAPPSVNSEHNYCGRVPEPDPHHHHHHHHHHPAGTITPSDTEDEVDVVSCVEHSDVPRPSSTITTTTTTHSIPSAATTTTTTRLPPPKRSVDVKRQLQLAIQEAMRNRQNRGVAAATATTTTPAGGWTQVEGEDATSRLVSVKIKTQGKPAAYTKRMRDYHSEVVKSTKHRRRNRGESDEGRRSVHNSLERQRRVDLRNAFEYLRLLVPDTKVLEKAPKVQILKKAALHCKNLQHTEQRLLREKEKLKKQLEELQQRKALSS